MKKLQKVKLVFKAGKQEKKENIGKPRAVVDSVADELSIDSDQKIEEAKSSKKIKTVIVWEEKSVIKKKAVKASE